MAKGTGLIGNFNGKVGNTVGYVLKDSNNKQTQGIRVYQPIVKNPKTYGQAEQRAKLAPINATYRALKAIIDRGQEGKAYGNKSRLAWLSDAMKAFNGGWFEKGAAITAPALVPLTKGSLPDLFVQDSHYEYPQVFLKTQPATTPTTIAALSTALLNDYPSLSAGDQITFIKVETQNNAIVALVGSIVLDTQDTNNLPSFLTIDSTEIGGFNDNKGATALAVIISREGDNGAHLRSTTSLIGGSDYPASTQGDAAKEAAIKSYMAAGANTDWAEESLQ